MQVFPLIPARQGDSDEGVSNCTKGVLAVKPRKGMGACWFAYA